MTDPFGTKPRREMLGAVMARYHYDILGDYPFHDEEGAEHHDDRAAWRGAVKMVRDIEEHLRPDGKWTLSVREGNRLVYFIEVTAKTLS